MEILHRLNPAVPRSVLPFIAGGTWDAVGVMLMVRSGGWFLGASVGRDWWLALAGGLVMASLMIPGIFLRIVRKNLDRLALRPERACLFSVFAWRSWALVTVMSVGGVMLRHGGAPRLALAGPYLGMGLCLLSGAVLYLRGATRR